MPSIYPLIFPDWPAPDNIRAACTTREEGYSQPPWSSFNFAEHVGDDTQHVAANRRKLQQILALPGSPHWLKQTHGTTVHQLDGPTIPSEADAAYTQRPDTVCVVMTADCLPVLFTDRQGRQIAAAHAGWRGLASGILENTLACFSAPDQVIAWLGPAIGPTAFEVGEAVRAAFIQRQPHATHAFTPTRAKHWYADLYQLARLRLMEAGVRQISGGEYCTYSDAERFYSYRRDKITGRMACLIWRETTPPSMQS
jgi:YfiH family protein